MITLKGAELKWQFKKYSVIILIINSMYSRSVRKRILNFYDLKQPFINGIRPNESERVP
jgi:hypothetical protein